MMHPELAADDEAVERFTCEAMAAARLRSPHIVQVLDQGTTDAGVPYMVMEYLEGRDLGVVLEEHGGKLAPRDVYAIVSQLARALGRAHAAGIVHRDIKPANIFLAGRPDDTPFVKLLDFGVAKFDRPGLSTRTGSIMGTPVYMAPEQIVSGRRVDPRSDVWSVGVVAFQVLTGAKPFQADDFGELVLRLHGNEKPPRMTDIDPTLPVALDVWFAKACAKELEDRYASVDELVVALRAALSSRPASPPHREASKRTLRRALLGAGGVALLASVVAIASGNPRVEAAQPTASAPTNAPTSVVTLTQATRTPVATVEATGPRPAPEPTPITATVAPPKPVAARVPQPAVVTGPAPAEAPTTADDGLLYRR
jgi:eukaryotic-like serine/threonine-protein kinase